MKIISSDGEDSYKESAVVVKDIMYELLNYWDKESLLDLLNQACKEQ